MKAKLLFLLMILALASALPAAAETHRLENEALVLTIDEQTLEMTLQSKRTDGTIKSGADASGTSANASWRGFLGATVSLDVCQGTAVNTERLDLLSAQTTIRATAVPGGVDALIDFTEKGQRVKLEIRLEGDSVLLRVPGDGIEEYGETSLCGLYLAPCMGATHFLEKQGYMLVPEAAGAIIAFSDGDGVGNTPYSKRIYGGNVGVDRTVNTTLSRPAEKITMPVYGMAYTDDGLGFLAVVESGGEAAELMAYPAGVITEFNWIGAHFLLREEYIMQTTRTMGLRSRESKAYLRDMAVRFYLLEGDEATYAGMARRYRRALEEVGALKTVDASYRPMISFLGAESEKMLLWDTLVPMTTVEQAIDILQAYLEQGLSAPLVSFRGWESGGLSRALGSGSNRIERGVGTAAELRTLRDKALACGGAFMLETDALQANPERAYNMRLDVVRTIGQTVAQIPTGKDRYPNFYYLTPARTRGILADYCVKYGKQFPTVALVELPCTLYSYYSAGKNHTRGDTQADYSRLMETMTGEAGMTLALDNPLAAYYAYMSAYLNMPLGATSYAFLKAEVPFLPMVLSGHVPYYAQWANFSSNQARQLLKLVEYGAYPAYLVTGNEVQRLSTTNSCDVFSAKWDVVGDSLLATDAALAALHESLSGRTLIDHRLPLDNVAVAVYSGGVEVVVNYNAAEIVWMGRTVPAMGYLVLEGGNDE